MTKNTNISKMSKGTSRGSGAKSKTPLWIKQYAEGEYMPALDDLFLVIDRILMIPMNEEIQ